MCRAVMAQYVAGSLPPTTQGWEGGGGEEGHSRYWPPGFRAPGSYPAPGPCLLYNCDIMTVQQMLESYTMNLRREMMERQADLVRLVREELGMLRGAGWQLPPLQPSY